MRRVSRAIVIIFSSLIEKIFQEPCMFRKYFFAKYFLKDLLSN